MDLHFASTTLELSFNELLTKLTDERSIDRLWKKDHTLWSPDPTEIENRLGWLDAPMEMLGNISEIETYCDAFHQREIDHIVLIGMGGSSLAAEVFFKSFGGQKGRYKFTVMDSTHPHAVHQLAETLSPDNTHFIVATKSGGTVETISLFRYFFQWLVDAGADPGGQFTAITDPGSSLEQNALQFDFFRCFLNNANIGGRYSALSYFGLVPAGLADVNLETLLRRAVGMARACQLPAADRQNPAAVLGAFLAAGHEQGRDKLLLDISPELVGFGDWIEQMIAESTGKDGKGLLPIMVGGGSPFNDSEHEKMHVSIKLAGEAGTKSVDGGMHSMPSLWITLNDVYDLGSQFFLWEAATAIAGSCMGIHPFNQPNVEAAKTYAKEKASRAGSSAEERWERIPESSDPDLLAFIRSAKPCHYIAIQAYLPPDLQTKKALIDFGKTIENHTGMIVTTAFGPRYLHSTGQLHKGDGGNGRFIQIIGVPEIDLAIPLHAGTVGSELSFGRLMQAQAEGDAQALRRAGRPVLTIDVHADYREAIEKLSESIGEIAHAE